MRKKHEDTRKQMTWDDLESQCRSTETPTELVAQLLQMSPRIAGNTHADAMFRLLLDFATHHPGDVLRTDIPTAARVALARHVLPKCSQRTGEDIIRALVAHYAADLEHSASLNARDLANVHAFLRDTDIGVFAIMQRTDERMIEYVVANVLTRNHDVLRSNVVDRHLDLAVRACAAVRWVWGKRNDEEGTHSGLGNPAYRRELRHWKFEGDLATDWRARFSYVEGICTITARAFELCRRYESDRRRLGDKGVSEETFGLAVPVDHYADAARALLELLARWVYACNCADTVRIGERTERATISA